MRRLLNTLKGLVSPGDRAEDGLNRDSRTGSSGSEAVDEASVKRLMQLIENTNEGEFSCEETFDLLDEYVELVDDDQQAAMIMPYLYRHLQHCVDCQERYETLLAILQTS